jgi:hypothetical protein
MPSQTEVLHEGLTAWTNQHGIRILRLHYSADEEKGKGEKVYVEQIKRWLTPWALDQYQGMTDKAAYNQEYEIDFSAKLGTLMFQFEAEATLEKTFPIPADWTRYYGLDPHPVVPHASLWLAVDPWGDAWIYREFWPSRVYGLPGNVPEDDNRYSIKDYVEAVKWLESKENPENKEPENICRRVIDYAARSFGQGMSDETPELNFQDRFEQLGLYPFQDCIKDHEAGISAVNEWLKPRDVEQRDGTFKAVSRLHIFEDRCPELIYQLKTNRYQQLTPLLAERQDPTGKPVAKRNHMTDILRYLCMAEPIYIPKRTQQQSWKPIWPGTGY